MKLYQLPNGWAVTLSEITEIRPLPADAIGPDRVEYRDSTGHHRIAFKTPGKARAFSRRLIAAVNALDEPKPIPENKEQPLLKQAYAGTPPPSFA